VWHDLRRSLLPRELPVHTWDNYVMGCIIGCIMGYKMGYIIGYIMGYIMSHHVSHLCPIIFPVIFIGVRGLCEMCDMPHSCSCIRVWPHRALWRGYN